MPDGGDGEGSGRLDVAAVGEGWNAAVVGSEAVVADADDTAVLACPVP